MKGAFFCQDQDIAVFASQVLTSKSWYKGVDSHAAEAIMGEMIESAIKGEMKISDIINLNAKKVQQTIHRKE